LALLAFVSIAAALLIYASSDDPLESTTKKTDKKHSCEINNIERREQSSIFNRKENVPIEYQTYIIH